MWKFPYTRISVPACAAFSQTYRLRPLLDLTLHANQKHVTVSTLVDSGADFCVFPADLAPVLGIKLPNARVMSFGGADSRSTGQTAYFEHIQISFIPPGGTEQRVKVYAGFCDTLSGPVVGQVGFFSQFYPDFHYPDFFTLTKK